MASLTNTHAHPYTHTHKFQLTILPLIWQRKKTEKKSKDYAKNEAKAALSCVRRGSKLNYNLKSPVTASPPVAAPPDHANFGQGLEHQL